MCGTRSILRDTRGAVAVEFAMVASVMLVMILFIMGISLLLFMNQALDNAAANAARQIMTGVTQKNGTGKDDFRTKTVCPQLPFGFVCSNVLVNIQTVPQTAQPGGYYTLVKSDMSGLIVPASLTGASGGFALGSQGSYEYLQIIYPITFLPTFITRTISGGATYNGSPAYLMVATAAFRNEQY